MINKVYIINNLYHYNILKVYFDTNNFKSDSLVFYDSEITIKDLNGFVQIPKSFRGHYADSLFDKYFNIKSIIKYIKNLNLKFNDKLNLYLCTDREIFNQLFITIVKPTSVHLFDEGIGMYRKRFLKSYIKNLFYIFFSKIIFKNKIFFVQPLGSNPYVTDLYIRRKDLLGYKTKSLKYHNLDSNSETYHYNNQIFIILPYDEKSFSKKIDFLNHLNSIILELSKYNKVINLKPHPRDQTDYKDLFGHKNIFVFSNLNLAEDLCLPAYSLIINYRSSSILTLVFNGNDLNNILTLSLDKNHIEDDIYPNMFYFNDLKKIFSFASAVILDVKYFNDSNV